MDDSGSVLNPDESFFVLGGVIVPEEKHFWVNKHLDSLAKNVCENDPLSVEFHASEIFSGRRGYWANITDKNKRIEIINSVLDVPTREKLATIACAVEKRFYSLDDVIKLAFEDVISRFQSFLTYEHRNTGLRNCGIIIFDKSASETYLQNLALRFRGEGTRYRQITGVQEVPLFVDSRASRAIQLADHVSYAVFRRYNACDLKYFNKIQNQFEMCGSQCQPKEYGLFHMTKDYRNCACPACQCAKFSSP